MPHNFSFTPMLRITTLNNCLTLNFPHPYNFKGEFHPFWEMVYALEDGFQVAENEKVYTMKKGGEPKKVEISIGNDREALCYFLVFCYRINNKQEVSEDFRDYLAIVITRSCVADEDWEEC